MRFGQYGRRVLRRRLIVVVATAASVAAVSMFGVASAGLASTLANVPCAAGTAGLISAIDTANSNGGGTINLAAGCTYQLTGAENGNPVTGDNGLPVVSSRITINGRGTMIAGDGSARILQVDARRQRHPDHADDHGRLQHLCWRRHLQQGGHAHAQSQRRDGPRRSGWRRHCQRNQQTWPGHRPKTGVGTPNPVKPEPCQFRNGLSAFLVRSPTVLWRAGRRAERRPLPTTRPCSRSYDVRRGPVWMATGLLRGVWRRPNRDGDAGGAEPFHAVARLLSRRAGRPPSFSKFTLPVKDRPSICFKRLGA
jgi:hypothetical protein